FRNGVMIARIAEQLGQHNGPDGGEGEEMTIRRMVLLSVLFVLALPSAALANMYVGVAAGQAATQDQVGKVDFNDDTTGWKVYGGFRFIKFLGVEASYVDLGNPSDS